MSQLPGFIFDTLGIAGEGLSNANFANSGDFGASFGGALLQALGQDRASRRGSRELERDRELRWQLAQLDVDPELQELRRENARLSNETLKAKLNEQPASVIPFDLMRPGAGMPGITGAAPGASGDMGGPGEMPGVSDELIGAHPLTNGKVILSYGGHPISGPLSTGEAKTFLEWMDVGGSQKRRETRSLNDAYRGLVSGRLDPKLAMLPPDQQEGVLQSLDVLRSLPPEQYRIALDKAMTILDAGGTSLAINEMVRLPRVRRAEIEKARTAADVAQYDRQLQQMADDFRGAMMALPEVRAGQEVPATAQQEGQMAVPGMAEALSSVFTVEQLTEELIADIDDPAVRTQLRIYRARTLNNMTVLREARRDAIERQFTIWRGDEDPDVEVMDRTRAIGLPVEETLGWTYVDRAMRHYPGLMDVDSLASAAVKEAAADLRDMKLPYAQTMAMAYASGQQAQEEQEEEDAAAQEQGQQEQGQAQQPQRPQQPTPQAAAPQQIDPAVLLGRAQELLKAQGITASDQEVMDILGTPEGAAILQQLQGGR